QAGEKPVERNDRSVRVCRACKMLEQQRYDFRELGARELAFERAVASAVPAPHQRRDLERAAKTFLSEAIERLAIVRLGQKTQAAAAGLGSRRILEQGRIMALHIAQMDEQGLRESITIGKGGETGKALQAIAIGRQGVGLLVGDHLQTVLEET